jgi:RNA polymerase sigma-70 factor (ECF subfamily)
MGDLRAVDDEELVAAVLARRAGAWWELQRRFERVMAGCIRNAMRRYGAFASPEDLEDILATVLLQLVKDDYKKLRAFDAGRGFRLSSWLGLIATRTALDALRRRPPASSPLEADDDRQHADSAPLPLDALERRRQGEALLGAIRGLAPGEQAFLRLYYEDALDADVIAAQLGISVNTVYSRKNKLRDKLRRLLEPEGPAAPAGGKVGDGSA